MLQKALIAAFCLALLFGCASSEPMHHHHGGGESEWAPKIQWRTLADARAEAKGGSRPLLIDFYVPEGCHRCAKMVAAIYEDPECIEKINRDFIPVKINLTRQMTPEERELGRKYDFDFECLLVFEKPDGQLVEDEKLGRFCFVDAPKREWFLKYLDKALALSAEG